MSARYAHLAQRADSNVSAYTWRPTDVAPPDCHHPSRPEFGHSPVHAANHHIHPAYTAETFEGTGLEPQTFSEAHTSSGRPPCMLSYSMHGQQHTSPQQLFASNHSLPPAQHQIFEPAGQPAAQHLQAQPTDARFAPQAAAECRQPGDQAAVGVQHATPASGLHDFSPWQYNSPAVPQSSSPLLYHAAFSAAAASAAAASAAPSCRPGQPQSTMSPQHAAAVGVPLRQADVTAQMASTSQPSGLVSCPVQSMLLANDPTPRASPDPTTLAAGSFDPQVLLGATACGAARHNLDSLAGQMHRPTVGAAMPVTQEAASHTAHHSLLQGQQSSSVQQQQQLLLPLPSGRLASSLPAQQHPTVPGRPGPIPLLAFCTKGAGAAPTAAGSSSLPTAAEHGQPATTSLATAACCPAATCNALNLIPPTHATGDVSIHHPSAPGSTAVPSTHNPDSRPVPDIAQVADVVKPAVVPQRTAWPGSSLPAQTLTSTSAVPGQVTPLDTSPQLRQTTDICASTDNRSAAASLALGVGHTAMPAKRVASDGSFRFQPQTEIVQVSPVVCCTPVLRPRSQEVAYAGMSAAMDSLHYKGPSMQSCSTGLAGHTSVQHGRCHVSVTSILLDNIACYLQQYCSACTTSNLW